jgi:hypothetical protein
VRSEGAGRPEEICEDFFEVPLSLGTVANLQAHMSEALAPAHAEALSAVRAAPVKNVDETGWKLAGKLCWLWVAATGTVAAFLIHARRGWEALRALLGEQVEGFVCSDRWGAYAQLSPFSAQICSRAANASLIVMARHLVQWPRPVVRGRPTPREPGGDRGGALRPGAGVLQRSRKGRAAGDPRGTAAASGRGAAA